MPDLIDLHVHTSFSDGSYRPRQVIDLAVQAGLKAIAITDHDTVAGNPEAAAYAGQLGYEVVPGVEISVESDYNSFHILGYFIDYTDPGLNATLKEVLDFRDNRNPKIIAQLNALGVDITMDEVSREAGGNVVGRPHMAAVMVKKGYVRNVQEAFDRYLKTGAPAHVDKKRITKAQGIRLVKAAGGIPVWAHPGFTPWKDINEMETELKHLIGLGLEGVEAFYTTYTEEQTSHMLKLAEKYDLLITGGSDFHGKTKADIKLGQGRGNLQIDYQYLATLKARARTGP